MTKHVVKCRKTKARVLSKSSPTPRDQRARNREQRVSNAASKAEVAKNKNEESDTSTTGPKKGVKGPRVSFSSSIFLDSARPRYSSDNSLDTANSITYTLSHTETLLTAIPPEPAKDTDIDGTFVRFPRLPVELRRRIWHLVLGPKSRVIKINIRATPHFVQKPCYGNLVPAEINLNYHLEAENPINAALLSVCRESRAEAKKWMPAFIQLFFKTHGPKVRFNPAEDTIYLNQESLFVLAVMQCYSTDWEVSTKKTLINFTHVQKLGVDEVDIKTLKLLTMLQLTDVLNGVKSFTPIADPSNTFVPPRLPMTTATRKEYFRYTFLEKIWEDIEKQILTHNLWTEEWEYQPQSLQYLIFRLGACLGRVTRWWDNGSFAVKEKLEYLGV